MKIIWHVLTLNLYTGRLERTEVSELIERIGVNITFNIHMCSQFYQSPAISI